MVHSFLLSNISNQKRQDYNNCRQTDTNSDRKQYQTQGGRPGSKRKLSLKEQLFMVLIRLKVGLCVRDLSERFEISQSQFSKTFTTWINFLNAELPLLFPYHSQQKKV